MSLPSGQKWVKVVAPVATLNRLAPSFSSFNRFRRQIQLSQFLVHSFEVTELSKNKLNAENL